MMQSRYKLRKFLLVAIGLLACPSFSDAGRGSTILRQLSKCRIVQNCYTRPSFFLRINNFSTKPPFDSTDRLSGSILGSSHYEDKWIWDGIFDEDLNVRNYFPNFIESDRLLPKNTMRAYLLAEWVLLQDSDQVRELVDARGIDPSGLPTEDDSPPLAVAALTGNPEIFEFLLSRKAEITEQVIRAACAGGNPVILDMLAARYPLESFRALDDLPHISAQNGQLVSLKFLYEKIGFDLGKHFRGKTPLERAVNQGHPACAGYLATLLGDRR